MRKMKEDEDEVMCGHCLQQVPLNAEGKVLRHYTKFSKYHSQRLCAGSGKDKEAMK